MIYLFILGALIGSFLNVVIFRLPNNQSIITPRSHCNNCKKSIPFYLNIPIISYVMLRGKCQNCHAPISPQYIIVELLTGILFYFAFYGLPIDKAILLSIVFSCLIIISFIDYYYYLIPSSLLFSLLVLLIPYSLLFEIPIYQILIGAFSITSYLLICTLLVSFFKKQTNILGFGDVLLILFIGGWLGVIDSFFCLFISSIIGICYIVCNNIISGNEKSNKIPFGTCLSISFIIISLLKVYIDFKLIIF